MTDRRLRAALVGLGLAAALASGAGTGVRATRGAQVTADEPQYLLSALALAETGSLDISGHLADERWRTFHEAPLPQQTRPLPGGRRVSPHDPLLPLLLAAPMAVGGWVCAKLTLSFLAGVLASLTAWTAVRRFGVRPPVALSVTAAFALSAPLAVYGTQVYPELPAALAVTAAVAALTGPWGRSGRVLVVAAVVALPWLAVKYAPVAAALAGVALVRLWRSGERRVVGGMVLALTAATVVYAVVHVAVYTGVTPYAAGDHFVGGQLTVVGTAPDYLGRSRRLLGLLVDRHFGLAAWQPAWLLAVPAFAALLRRRPRGWEALTVPFAAGWCNATFVALTMHGYWFAGRQVVVVLPLAVLAVAVLADRRRWALASVLVLGVLGVWSYGWLLADGLAGRITWVVGTWSIGDPWYRLWSGALPAYWRVTGRTWVLHGAWLVAAIAAGWLAWRDAGHRVRSGDPSVPWAP